MIVSFSLKKLQIFVPQKVYKICLLVSGRHESIFSLEHVLTGEGLLYGLTYQGQELSKGLLSPGLLSNLLDVRSGELPLPRSDIVLILHQE